MTLPTTHTQKRMETFLPSPACRRAQELRQDAGRTEQGDRVIYSKVHTPHQTVALTPDPRHFIDQVRAVLACKDVKLSVETN